MLDKFKISLWDLFTFFISGAIVLILFKFYGLSSPIAFEFGNSELISGTFYSILTYTVGILFEPIANFLFNQLVKIYEWKNIFKKLKRLKVERDEVYFPKIKQIVVEKYGFSDEKTDFYQIARTYIVKKNIDNSYMIFLSRFGFYRNLSIICFLNVILFPLFKHGDFTTIQLTLISLGLFILHIILYARGREFFFYTGNEIYRNFILDHKQNCT